MGDQDSFKGPTLKQKGPVAIERDQYPPVHVLEIVSEASKAEEAPALPAHACLAMAERLA
jgi:hypothetical protein